MNTIKTFQNHLTYVLLLTFLNCHGQSNDAGTNPAANSGGKVVGGPFENGEFMYIGKPEWINSVDTSAGWSQPGQKLLITGTIFKRDGKTPAPDVILYYYHTDINGYYSDKKGLDRRVIRHGYIRGWVKSDENGKYSIYTVRPAPYPDEDIPAHIHPSVKEPDIEKEYYIDEFVFDDDKLLTGDKRKALENRGGSGVLRVLVKNDLQIAEHDIILGMNVPNYPESGNPAIHSGLEIGQDNPSFLPFHAFGPDKGTRTCPVCKYGRYHGILYFVGNRANWDEIKSWLTYLEKESVTRSKYLKVYFIYGNGFDYSKEKRHEELEKIGEELKLQNVALTFVPSFSDTESEVCLNKINPDVENTFILYRQSKIISKFVSLKPALENFKLISGTLNKTKGDFFNLEPPK